AVLGRGPSPVPEMLAGARALEAAGCEAFAVACNTAHHWADELAAGVGIPLLHIADAAVAALSRLPVPVLDASRALAEALVDFSLRR
ncbi:MAG: aspartate/glutamate racemase family protein, partial [Burkholderiales bacterium]|nr:aspartate/glutamate racemase family protein [Burkholderiales bacterium]